MDLDDLQMGVMPSINFFAPFDNVPCPLNFTKPFDSQAVFIPSDPCTSSSLSSLDILPPDDFIDSYAHWTPTSDSLIANSSDILRFDRPCRQTTERRRRPLGESVGLRTDSCEISSKRSRVSDAVKHASSSCASTPPAILPISQLPISSESSGDRVVLRTEGMEFRQLCNADWLRFEDVHNADYYASSSTNSTKLRGSFESHLYDWLVRRAGPFSIFINTSEGPFFGGFVKYWFENRVVEPSCHPLEGGSIDSPTNRIEVGITCVHIRFALLPQFCRQRRVLLESILVTLKWILTSFPVFGESGEIYVPSEIPASRANTINVHAIICGGDSTVDAVLEEATLVTGADVQEFGQQKMLLVSRSDCERLINNLSSMLASREIFAHLITEDIWTSTSAKGLFRMVVKWEIPLLKVEEDHELRLFISTYHDTPVETLLTQKAQELIETGYYKMELGLHELDSEGNLLDMAQGKRGKRNGRGSLKDIVVKHHRLAFSGVRKSKVGDKNKHYVIRTRLWKWPSPSRGSGSKSKNSASCPPVLIDWCISSACQMTSSRKGYRVLDERVIEPGVVSTVPRAALLDHHYAPLHVDAPKTLLDWASSSSVIAAEFAQCVEIYWKEGFSGWLFTQEKVSFEVMDFYHFPEAKRLKMQLIDVQSRLPIQLVVLQRGGDKLPGLELLVPQRCPGSWTVDLRVFCKKEVHNRSCYIHISLLEAFDSHVSVAEFTTQFCVRVGTTYANLKKQFSAPASTSQDSSTSSGSSLLSPLQTESIYVDDVEMCENA